jgi:Fur family ferric uptake transcriptional regulator
MPYTETGVPGALQTVLVSRGIRLTRQRRIILGIIETAQQHLDAAQILRKAVKTDPHINRVTVYRTLALLKRQGLVDELDLLHINGEGHFYERHPQRDHMHMTCLRCGKVQEFESELLDRVKWQVERDCNFHIAISRFEIGGHCVNCRERF